VESTNASARVRVCSPLPSGSHVQQSAGIGKLSMQQVELAQAIEEGRLQAAKVGNAQR
jgi:hypothetical protein